MAHLVGSVTRESVFAGSSPVKLLSWLPVKNYITSNNDSVLEKSINAIDLLKKKITYKLVLLNNLILILN